MKVKIIVILGLIFIGSLVILVRPDLAIAKKPTISNHQTVSNDQKIIESAKVKEMKAASTKTQTDALTKKPIREKKVGVLEKTVPELIEELKISSGYGLYRRVIDLGDSNDSRGVDPIIDVLLNSDDKDAREAAVIALSKLGKSIKDRKVDITRALKKALKDKEYKVAAYAASALLSLNTDIQLALETLDNLAQKGCVWGIQELFYSNYTDGKKYIYTKEGIKNLKNALNYEDEWVRLDAAHFLVIELELKTEYNKAFMVVKDIYKNSKNIWHRRSALKILGKIGNDEAINIIKEASNDEDEDDKIINEARKILKSLENRRRLSR